MKGVRSKRAMIIRWTSIVVVAVLVTGTLGVYIALRAKLDKITHIAKIDIAHRPPRYTDALNLLVLGSDNRHGHNGSIGGRYGCNCSDTVMLVHISPGRGKVTAVSIPRDTMVPTYACSPWNGLPGQVADVSSLERINGTLAAGGPECVRETVEQQSGVYINDVLELDFTGFEQMINDVGGVNICIPFAIHNTISIVGGTGLTLAAGRHHIWGRQALQFWRTRENVADGSDIARIARDQYFLAQLVKGVLHSGLLHSPTKLYTVLGDVAGNLQTDASDTDLLHIATSLAGIKLADIQFVTAPWVTYPYDPNEVEFEQPQANALFYALAHDSKLPKISKKKQSASPTPTPTVSTAGQPLTVSPAQVKVMILNGSDGTDETATADADLTDRGFDVVGTGYADTTSYTQSVIEYGSAADLPAADTLKQQIPNVTIKLTGGLTAGTVELILGNTFTKLTPPKQTSQSISGLSTNYGGITAKVKCRNSAFYGVYDQAPTSSNNTCAC
jgi:LCP family protein required for cell wall assembly